MNFTIYYRRAPLAQAAYAYVLQNLEGYQLSKFAILDNGTGILLAFSSPLLARYPKHK